MKSRHWAVQCDGEVQANADYEANEVINKINHPISELFELFSALLCFASTLPEQMLPELSLPFPDNGSNWGGGGGGGLGSDTVDLPLSSFWRRRWVHVYGRPNRTAQGQPGVEAGARCDRLSRCTDTSGKCEVECFVSGAHCLSTAARCGNRYGSPVVRTTLLALLLASSRILYRAVSFL